MDCQTANEYINAYADNMLNKKEAEQLFSHISSCSKCRKDLDDCLAVKKALAGLGEIKPPVGLAMSAIMKAKKRRIPVFAYASAGIAAVIALVAVFSSNMFNNNYAGEDRAAQPAAYSQALAEDNGPQASREPEAATMEGLALAPAPTPAATTVPASEKGDFASNETRKASVPYITVPAKDSEIFRELLVKFLDSNSIDYDSYKNSGLDTISFTITEDKLEGLKTLVNEYLQYEYELNAGTIQFIFEI